MQKKTQIQKKNWLNRSSDEGDIGDLKSALFPGNFVTTRKMKQIGVLAKNLYALEVQDACKALRSKAKVRYLVVERESKLLLNMQRQKKSQTIVEEPQLVKQLQKVVEQPQLEKSKGDRVLMQRPPVGENFEPSGHREHMQPYLQVRDGAM